MNGPKIVGYLSSDGRRRNYLSSIHLTDLRRPIARTQDGKPWQIPVICVFDIITVVHGGDAWTDVPERVTCPDCLRRIEESHDQPD